jgi:hypothetical protein
MSATQTLKQGQMIGPGRFTLIKELGSGGMGVVWLLPHRNPMTSATCSTFCEKADLS